MKIILNLIICLVIFCSVCFQHDNVNNSNILEEVSLNEKYKLVGMVSNYRLYQDTSVTIFPQALEYIYEDENYKYYFREIKSHVYLLVNDEEELGIKEALQREKISIDDLRKVISIYKIEK